MKTNQIEEMPINERAQVALAAENKFYSHDLARFAIDAADAIKKAANCGANTCRECNDLLGDLVEKWAIDKRTKEAAP